MTDPNAWDDEDFPVAMFIQEPCDPSKIPMYCKNKVYDEGIEFSLEEIRARRYSRISNCPASTKDKEPTFELYSDVQKIDATNCAKVTALQVKGMPENSSLKNLSPRSKKNPPSIRIPCIEDKENYPLAKCLEADGNSRASLKHNKENLCQIFTKYENKEEQDYFSETENVVKSAANFDLDVTSYTKAFNLPVSSSTPFIGNRKTTTSLHKENGRDFIGLGKVSVETTVVQEPAVGVIKELSVIEESSKECVSASSGTNSGSGVSTAECEHPSNPSLIDGVNPISVQQNISRIPSVMAGGGVECIRSKNTRIPFPVSRVQSKEIDVNNISHLKDSEPDQNAKVVVGPDDLCKQFDDLVLSDDPFELSTTNQLLKSMKIPLSKRKGFHSFSRKIPNLKSNSDLHLGQDMGDVGHILKSLKVIGQGAYAKVYKGLSSKWHRPVAIKVQKPPCEWEYYISKEIHERLQEPKMKNCFMDVKEAYFFIDGSMLLSDFMEFGTLLDAVNMYKVRRSKLPEVLAVYFTLDVLKIVDCLHSCHIIHGDIKPDNFLLREIPAAKLDQSQFVEPSLQLIDLGRCIDMTLFPKNACFSVIFQKTCFQCIEMRTKKPWTYQVDFFAVASLIHLLVFADFMDVFCKDGVWNVSKKVPRNMNQSLWNWLFHVLLNIESCLHLPKLDEIIRKVETYFYKSMAHELGSALRTLRSMLNEEKSKRK